MIQLMPHINVYHDVETTGLKPSEAHVVEVGCVYDIEGAQVGQFHSLCNPGEDAVRSIKATEAFKVNKIDPEEVLRAPTVEYTADSLRYFELQLFRTHFGRDVEPVFIRHAFNNGFDKGFLSRVPWALMEHWGECVMLRARDVLNPGGKWLSLDVVRLRLGLEWEGQAHRALEDAKMARLVHQRLR